MANPGAIADISVNITGDYSDLNDSVTSAVSAAQEGAQQIASAFDVSDVGAPIEESLTGVSTAADSAATQLGLFGDDLGAVPFDSAAAGAGDLADALEPMAGAADAAANAADSLADSATNAGSAAGEAASGIKEAGDAATEAETGLSGMAEQLLAVGEALVITEGLREFGTEALNAADNVTRATIALTALTGSGEQAKTTIAGLEELGISDGLSFPSLLIAATRMTAILGPGADVITLLGDIANGAKAMGTDIVSATTKFDQMATAGTASARTLTQLGLSLQSLSHALNQVNPAANSTAADVAKMFKAMDETDRITVLTTALSRLAGVAQQTAQATFGGQWTQLANAWDQVMVQVGEDLLPVISDLLSFARVDVLPFLKGLADAFSALPQPIQEMVIAVSLVAAAIVPLTAIVGAFGLALSGLQTIVPTVTALLAALGLQSTETATAETADAAAATAAGEAHAGEVAGIEAAEGASATLGTTLGSLAATMTGPLAMGFLAFVAASADMKERMQGLHDAADQLHTSLLQHIQDVVSAAQTYPQFQSAISLVNQALENGSISEKQAAADMQTLATNAQKAGVDLSQSALGGDALTASVQKLDTASAVAYANQTSLGVAIRSTVSPAQEAAAAVQAHSMALASANAALVAAKQHLTEVVASYNANTASANDVAKAQGAVEKAMQAVTAAMKDGTSAAGTNQALTDSLSKSLNALVTSELAELQATANDSVAISDMTTKLKAWSDAHAAGATAVQSATDALDPFNQALADENDAQSDLATLLPDVVSATTDLSSAVQNVAQAQLNSNTASVAATAAQQALNTASQQTSSITTALVDKVAAAQQAYDTAKAKLDALVASQKQGNDVAGLVVTAYDNMVAAGNRLKAANDALTATYPAASVATMQLGNDLFNAAHQADIDNASLGYLGDTLSGPLLAGLHSAVSSTNDFATSTDTLEKNLQQAVKTIGNDLASALTDMIDGTKSVGQAFEDLGKQVLQVCLDVIIKQALQPVEDAIGELFGATTKAAKTTTSSVGSSVGGILGAVSTVINVISGIVTAVSSVISAVEQAHSNEWLQDIEKNTRYLQTDYANQIPFGQATSAATQLTAAIAQNILNQCGNILSALQTGITVAPSSDQTTATPSDLLTAIAAIKTDLDQGIQLLAEVNQTLGAQIKAGTGTAGSTGGGGSTSVSGTVDLSGTAVNLLTNMAADIHSLASTSGNQTGGFGAYGINDISVNIEKQNSTFWPQLLTNFADSYAVFASTLAGVDHIVAEVSNVMGGLASITAAITGLGGDLSAIETTLKGTNGASIPSVTSGSPAMSAVGGTAPVPANLVTSSTSQMGVNIVVNGAQSPSATAREIAQHLRSISPVFTLHSK